eukprot:6465571-Amphidinium_carterae.1
MPSSWGIIPSWKSCFLRFQGPLGQALALGAEWKFVKAPNAEAEAPPEGGRVVQSAKAAPFLFVLWCKSGRRHFGLHCLPSHCQVRDTG